jgi:regulator of sirC expression with transglutaminase-like and TPR domain
MNRPLSSPAYCREPAYLAFAEQLPLLGTTRGLFRAAFSIARHERPTADVDQAEHAVASLAEAICRRVHSPNPQARLAHLHDVMFELIGFRGNTTDYYDPANSYLPEVLRTRRGLPITLVLVYKCVAEGVGLRVHGINTPGHFLAAVEMEGAVGAGAAGSEAAGKSSRMYVDPFYGGELLHEPEIFDRINQSTGKEITPSARLLAPATGEQWIARMLANLQAAFAAAGRERDLLAMQELQALLDEAIQTGSRRVQ